MRESFDRRHNPLWQCGPSGDAAAALLDFWRKTDPDTGAISHDFTDPDWNTRLLGNLYQDLSKAARKKYALLQTPEFIEESICGGSHALGLVWQAIVRQTDEPGSVSEWVSAGGSPRASFHRHPWSIGGGGAAELKEVIEKGGESTLGEVADQLRGKPNIGITAFTLEDGIFVQIDHVLRRHGLAAGHRRVIVEGDSIREWCLGENERAVWPYAPKFEPLPPDAANPALRYLWRARTGLANNFMFGKQTKVQAGLAWYEFGRLRTHELLWVHDSGNFDNPTGHARQVKDLTPCTGKFLANFCINLVTISTPTGHPEVRSDLRMSSYD
ncbi:MAG: hypothetical protein NTW21_19815 [Verrucomicrobia bacterium]|nr:hypothetical protein [Verrucomicrobiota bacterium]